ncbi:hypothetical protein BHE74_00009518 [Ensete ventricosum]|nr:hypothetical protein BHE74_00009518 [Ensete ventricosum]
MYISGCSYSNVSRDALVRRLPRGPAQRPNQGVGARPRLRQSGRGEKAQERLVGSQMCVLGCSCSDVHLEMLLFGGSRGVLHEGLVGVGQPDVIPPTIKSVSPTEMV